MTPHTATSKRVTAACPPTEAGRRFAAQFQQASRVLWLIAAAAVRNRSLADDVVQEAAMIALSKLDQFEAGTNFTAWMAQMVRNVAMNVGRKEKRRAGISLNAGDAIELEDRAAPWTGVGAGLGAVSGYLSEQQTHFDDRVLHALEEMSATARACLLLKTLEGLEYSEISRLLDIPEGTAMSHVHRSRQLLRRKLADFWRTRRESGDGQV